MPINRPKTDYANRKTLFNKISSLRQGRLPIIFFNFDRNCQPPNIPGLTTQFAADTKEILYRLLKESDCSHGIDLVLYTRGGDVNAVWPLVSLLREFDQKFEVLIPFRCHSSGTLLTLGARKIVLTRLSELSPVDPTTGNQFNPREETNPIQAKGISVEDVRSFFDLKATYSKDSTSDYLEILTKFVHPLALGNVQRVLNQVRELARVLLTTNNVKQRDEKTLSAIIKKLSEGFYSHVHAISRNEASSLLGDDQIVYANEDLEVALDALLRAYENTFNLRDQYILSNEMTNQTSKEVSYFGGVFECANRAYIFKTMGTWFQLSKIPPQVQLTLPPGAPLPLIPGLPTECRFELKCQDWLVNEEGV